ncbi:helix-turn-helix domain-containing protein [Streptomyces spongiicola]|uniref:Helix-turn-helix domain-containing protein n=1 Tax=Streptomyces spongiicola TaxID=1690221 RepID=A0A388T4P4_9ACTN|nr:helix-turn-helix transcriptional regulator [Streptomyces spongiicola]GBQ03496.1 helix-turn-helix domain-containing protein [Streptomyces spongiicola]
MPSDDDALFGAVDALLEEVASREPLPAPAERKRLREAAGLSQEQVAGVLQVRREAVSGWEAGRTEPRAPKRAAYARLLEGLAARYPAPEAEPTAPDVAVPGPGGTQPARRPAAAPAPPDAARSAAALPSPSRPAGGTAPARSHAPRRTVGPEDARRASAASAVDAGFAYGPLGVLDGDGSVYCLDGLVLDCPAGTVVEVVEWVLSEAKLGAARLHRAGRDADPLIVVTAAAAERLGLPAVLEDRRSLRLPQSHAVVKQIAKAGWKLTKRGFGPWARVYRPADGDRRQCVQFAVLPWDALDTRSWGDTALLPAPDVAAVLGTYACRVITPRGSTAVCGLELMTALRPPTRAVRDEASGTWVPGPVPGSLYEAVDPAPPEAPAEHPIVAGLYPRHHRRTADQVLDEEAFDWIREPELLTGAECARRFAVGIDVNTAFLAAANRLVVGLSAPVHVKKPAFDKKVPGAWLVDLSGIEFDPRLPNPFTPHGKRPGGPAWYATPTVAYAAELVAAYGLPVSIEPVEAWLRPESGPYLDPWYKRLSEAYRATMAGLGVVAGMGDAEFLTAMATHRQADPGKAAVLSAIKATVKGGIGKLRERPQGAGYRAGERWPALERPTWRPDIRAAVISTARVNMHRKILKTALATQHAPAPTGHLGLGDDALVPLALLSDCAVYPSDGPSPLDVLPCTPDGKPEPGTFRLGVSPGMVKHEGTQDLMWAVRMLEAGHNPAQHIKGTDAAHEGE